MSFSSNIIAFLDSEWGRRLPYIITGLVGILLLLAVISVIDKFSVDKVDTSQAYNQTSQAQSSEKIANISEWHIFGSYHPKVIDPKNLPETSLNLKLVGLYLANPEKYSHAIIAIPGEREKLYSLNQILPGDVKIYKILQDSVVLEHNGRLETLALPKQALKMEPPPTPILFEKQ